MKSIKIEIRSFYDKLCSRVVVDGQFEGVDTKVI